MKMKYIAPRIVLAAGLGVALSVGGLPWWGAAPAGAVALAFFVAAPRSGRYVVQEESGVAPLRRDERSRAIRDKAARNAFVATVLAVAGLTIAYGRVPETAVPVPALSAVLALAFITYAASDLCMRRTP